MKHKKKINGTLDTSCFMLHVPFRQGFTLVEIIGVIAVLGIITALSVSSLIRFNSREAVEQEVGKLLGIVSEARTLTISAKDGVAYGVHFEEHKAVLFQAPTYSEGATTNRVQMLSDAVRLSAISLTGGGADVVFKKLTGGTDEDGTITIVSTRDDVDARDIVITPTGAVYSNN